MSEQPGRDDRIENPWARPHAERQGEGTEVPAAPADPTAPPVQAGFAAPDAAAPVEPNPWLGYQPAAPPDQVQAYPPPGQAYPTVGPAYPASGPAYPAPEQGYSQPSAYPPAPGPYPPPAAQYPPAAPYPPAPGPYPPPAAQYPPAPPYPVPGAYPTSGGYPTTAAPYPTMAVPGYGQPGYPPPAVYGDPGFGAASAGAAAPYNLDAYGMPVPVRTDPMAGTSMGLGIGSLTLSLFSCCCWPIEAVWLVGGLVAVALGLISKRNIKAQPLLRAGSNYATTGIVTGAIAATLAAAIMLLAGLGLIAGGSAGSGP